MMTVAEYLAKYLVAQGVRHVFGFQGGAVLKLIDAIVGTGQIAYVQNYHEQASAFSADAYARVTGGLGVAIATSGPGATNLITGIVNAYLDSIPTLFLTGQDYAKNVLGKGAARQNGFQDVDIVSIVRCVTKYASLVSDPQRIRYELEKACWLARSGRPGAVLLDIPIDVQFSEIEPENLCSFQPEPQPEGNASSEIAKVVSLLRSARHPVILAGGGVRLAGAKEELAELARLTGIPVVSTLNGLDCCDAIHSFSGLHGNTDANLIVKHADVLLVLGARLGQRQVGKKPDAYTSARVIHVDIDAAELNRAMPEEVSIQGDLKPFLSALLTSLSGMMQPELNAPWRGQVASWSERYRENACLSKTGVDPVRLSRRLLEMLPDRTVVACDVGQNQMWVAQAFQARNGLRLLNSSGLGSMGYSLPAAIGASYASPDTLVVAFTGDGGLNMNLQELLLIGRKRCNILCVVMNNNSLGMMREVQKRYYDARYHGTTEEEFACPNLQKLADLFGLSYRIAEREEDLDADWLHAEGPRLLEVRLPRDSLLMNRYDEGPVFEREDVERA